MDWTEILNIVGTGSVPPMALALWRLVAKSSALEAKVEAVRADVHILKVRAMRMPAEDSHG